MPTSVTVNDLKINELTEAQYDAAVQGGVIGENELSVITDMTDKAVQVSTMPTASATELGNIYQFTGTTDANYTNGYFYKCVSDGQEPATYSWTQIDVQPATKVNTTATLAVADWSSSTQTVTVSGVTADSVVFVSPAPASASDYASAGILCTAQAANSLTFTCTTTPTNAITVNVICM